MVLLPQSEVVVVVVVVSERLSCFNHKCDA